MRGWLRVYVLACMGAALVYLLWHSREPLRLNIGDPWSDANVLSSIKYVRHYGFLTTSFTDILDVGPLTVDSYRYTHYPPLAEIFYGAIGKYFGVRDIATFRLFALAVSSSAMWLLYQYVRRLWNARTALISVMVFATSLLWLMYADSIHQAPVMQAAALFALWALVRAIETGKRRFVIATFLGSFACFFTSYDYWIFLPVAVVVTVWMKRGPRRLVVVCAAGCLLAILVKCAVVVSAVGWDELVADVHMQFFERATSQYDAGFSSAIPTLWRRLTLVFSPLIWFVVGYHVWRFAAAVRRRAYAAVVRDSALWLLVPGIAFFWLLSQLAASQMLAAQVLLPFYAIGSGLVVDRLLGGSRALRAIAAGWLLIAPAWGFGFMLAHPRSVLAREDVARVNQYLSTHDTNDFVTSNLLSVGHIQAAFEKHYWPAVATADRGDALAETFKIFELTGTTSANAIIFTDASSRFIDKSLWSLALPRRLWSIAGWPHLFPRKTNKLIRDFDSTVIAALQDVGAERVLQLSNFDVYRIDRERVLEQLAARMPAGPTRHIDFTTASGERHALFGWQSAPTHSAHLIAGHQTCGAASGRCATVLTKYGLDVKDQSHPFRASVLARLERACDLDIAVELAEPAMLQLGMNGYRARTIAPSTRVQFHVPASAVRAGLDEIALENLWGIAAPARVRSLDLSCH